MCDASLNLNDKYWELLFKKYDILNHIYREGQYAISARQIKEFREPRLMTKFDHSVNLPKIFVDNGLSILPISKGDYIISHFKAYHELEDSSVASISYASLPSYIQSLDVNNISSEEIALNCAAASGILADFLDDEELVPTVSGRMTTGRFNFCINNTHDSGCCFVDVNNSQMEIDAAYEGIQGLAIFEAKRDLSDDFLIRQLYYPYKAWREKITKTIRPVFLVYSNGIYRLYEYSFQNPEHYNSLCLVAQKNYSIEDTAINVADIQARLESAKTKDEPTIPFPQADKFERVVNLCELLQDQALSRNSITEEYAFDVRQTIYYTDAARYLGLIEKDCSGDEPVYSLSQCGNRILGLNFKQRQLAFCDCILSHKVFADTLRKYFESGNMPTIDDIIQIMKNSELYNIESESTFARRSSTVKAWINWIVSLINE